jgi:hypothetical protein
MSFSTIPPHQDTSTTQPDPGTSTPQWLTISADVASYMLRRVSARLRPRRREPWPTAEGTGFRWLGRKLWGLVWLRWMRGRHIVKVKGWRTALVDDPMGQRSTVSPCFLWFD